jgi:hypothetical protein
MSNRLKAMSRQIEPAKDALGMELGVTSDRGLSSIVREAPTLFLA